MFPAAAAEEEEAAVAEVALLRLCRPLRLLPPRKNLLLPLADEDEVWRGVTTGLVSIIPPDPPSKGVARVEDPLTTAP